MRDRPRAAGLAWAGAVAFLCGCAAAPQPPPAGSGAPPAPLAARPGAADSALEQLSAFERALFLGLNRIRRERSLPALTLRADLVAMARAQSRHMSRQGRLTHTGSDADSLEDRAAAASVNYLKIAENIARNCGYADPADRALRTWMASRGHREIMLRPRYDETGVGVVFSWPSGTYYLTQVFCLRKRPRPMTP